MNAIIITIGDEILYGQTIDTNSAWIGRELGLLGITLREILSISDDREAILEAIRSSSQRADIVFITGGLGPTRDDITKNCLAEFFGVGMKRNQDILKRLQQYFQKRGAETPEKTLPLADVPENCIALPNNKGTAWGMWFEEQNTIYVSMPGVPAEMKGLMSEQVLPKIKEVFELPNILHRHVLTAAVGESKLSDLLEDFEDQLPKEVKLAYLPGLGTVKLRLTAKGDKRSILMKLLDEQAEKLYEKVGRFIYGEDDDVFEAVIGKILKQKGYMIATAESCTGGYIAHRITSVAGSSDYYQGSIVSYSNIIKINELGVSERTLEKEGAVSEATVAEMLKGICTKYKTDVGIAVSGIAGPGGGTKEKPVGTVWIAVGKPDSPRLRKIQLPGNRLQNIEMTTVIALEMLRRYLLRDK